MKDRKKIRMDMSIMDVCLLMSEGNPGALSVLAQLMKEENGLFIILDLDDMGIRGSQIWVAYKDGCDSSIEKLKAFCRDRTQSIVDIVNKHCEHDCPRASTHGKS